MLECMEILSIVANKSFNVYAVKGNWRLDQSIQSKIIAMAFSMAAEIERELISQRTKEVLLRFRRAQGMKLGRPKGPGKSKLDAFRPDQMWDFSFVFWKGNFSTVSYRRCIVCIETAIINY
jgi:DNA invertase Pin-like site-specific DNA recombinase